MTPNEAQPKGVNPEAKKETGPQKQKGILEKLGLVQPEKPIKEKDTKQKTKIRQNDDREWAEKVVKDLKDNMPPDRIAELKALAEAQSEISAHSAKVSRLLPDNHLPQSELVATALADIASSGLENNPDYILAKAAQLQASMSADISPADLLEARQVLGRLKSEAYRLYGIKDNPEGEMLRMRNTIEQYSRPLGESGMTPAPGPQNNPAEFYDPQNPSKRIEEQDFADYKERGGVLESPDYRKFLDELTVVDAVSTGDPERWRDTEWLEEKWQSIQGFSSAPEDVRDHYGKKIMDKLTDLRRTQIPPDVHPMSVPSDWMVADWLKSHPDHPETLQDCHPQIKRIIDFSRQFGGEVRAENLGAIYQLIESVPVNYKQELSPTDTELINSLKNKVKEAYEAMKPSRFQLTAEKITKIMDYNTRDEVFYEVMQPLLDDPNSTSREVLNLYKEADIDEFMDAVGRLEGGNRIKEHYGELKRAVVSFHDLDYYARSAAGDVKSFQQATHYFNNNSAVLAMSDPIVESLTQCYEQALKQIRDNNDGYIPPSLVSYSSKTHENYWDKLAREIFEKKVNAGLIYDYERDDRGFGKIDAKTRAFLKGDKFELPDVKEQSLRITASMRMAKGMGILNGHLIEIFAFSKTPGYVNPDYGTQKLAFSSKAYEGIARWFNPMADWFGKYKMGDSMFAPFFGSLIGVDRSGLKEFMAYSPEEWMRFREMAATGQLHEYLQKRYGPKVSPLLDLVTEFAFSGRFGPLSTWGENDSTIGFNDLEREREGGSLRLQRAGRWAEDQVSRSWVNSKIASEYGARYENMSAEDRIQIRQKYEGEWRIHHKNDHAVEHLVDEYKRAYKMWVWVQTTMRSPTMVAGSVRVAADKDNPLSTISVSGEKRPRLLRNVIIQKILGINVERDVASEQTPSEHQKGLMKQIELLEGDVMLLQQKALNGGPDGAPRDIDLAADLTAIEGTITLKIDGRDMVVDQGSRREHAKRYIEAVREKMLGEWSYADWVRELGVQLGADGQVVLTEDAYTKTSYMQLSKAAGGNHIADRAGREAKALINLNLIDTGRPLHMGLEDVQWRYFDLEALGERHWARRGNDLEARSRSIMAMIKHIDTLRPHPDLKEMAKTLEEIYNAEKDHDPNEAHKFIFLMAKATGEMYREANYGKIPILGRVLSTFTESSIAQQIFGADHGAHWSTNNMREFLSMVSNATKLPHHHLDKAGNIHNYNMAKLEKELGATKFWAIMEMALIGSALTVAAVSLAAAAKGADDIKDEKGGH